MLKVRKIVSEALKIRDTNKIQVRQPLKELTIPIKLEEEFLEIIADEVNVKKVSYNNKSDQISLDLEITPELEAEGFAREIARKIQSVRKERDMKKEERIVLELKISENLKKRLSEYLEFISKRVGASKLILADKDKGFTNFELKGETIGFKF
jgi:isoleucyl-tRNA synthetase